MKYAGRKTCRHCHHRLAKTPGFTFFFFGGPIVLGTRLVCLLVSFLFFLWEEYQLW